MWINVSFKTGTQWCVQIYSNPNYVQHLHQSLEETDATFLSFQMRQSCMDQPTHWTKNQNHKVTPQDRERRWEPGWNSVRTKVWSCMQSAQRWWGNPVLRAVFHGLWATVQWDDKKLTPSWDVLTEHQQIPTRCWNRARGLCFLEVVSSWSFGETEQAVGPPSLMGEVAEWRAKSSHLPSTFAADIPTSLLNRNLGLPRSFLLTFSLGWCSFSKATGWASFSSVLPTLP